MAWSSAGQSNAPSSSSSGSKSSSSGSKSSSDSSSGGWGSASYAASNSSPMSGGYKSDGGSSSGSGWGGKSTANPSVTSQFGGGGSSSSGSSSSSSGSSLADSKRHAESLGTDIKGRDTNSGAPGNLAGADGVLASAPTMDAWSRNTAYTNNKTLNAMESQKGVYATPTARQYLREEIAAGRATPDMVTAGKAMISGKEAARGQQAMGGLLGVIGAPFGLAGMAGAKAATYGVGKAQDMLSEYGDNPSYQLSKQRTKDDGSMVGSIIGMALPRGAGPIAQAAYDDKASDYSAYINGLKSDMQKQGYISSTPTRNVQMNGSNNANGLLNTMFAQRQVTQPDTENSIAALNYGNFTPSYGSVI